MKAIVKRGGESASFLLLLNISLWFQVIHTHTHTHIEVEISKIIAMIYNKIVSFFLKCFLSFLIFYPFCMIFYGFLYNEYRV